MLDDLFAPVIETADPNAFEALHTSITRAQRIRHFLALDLAEHVAQILKERKKKRRWLARRLGKTDSELSKWLSGSHNLTLDSIAKLSDALEEDLIVSTRFPMGFFGSKTISIPAGITTNFYRAGGTLAPRPERFASKSTLPVYSRTTRPMVPGVEMAPVAAGDFTYAMAA